MFSAQKIIGLFPSWFATPTPNWPNNIKLSGFVRYEENGVLSDEVSQFLQNGTPPIIFTYTTGMSQGKEFFDTSIQATRILGKRALILTQYP